jgi:hypothetical protein
MAFFCLIGGIIVSKIGVRWALLVRSFLISIDPVLTSIQISSTGDIMFVIITLCSLVMC